MSLHMHMPHGLHSNQFKHTSQRCFPPKLFLLFYLYLITMACMAGNGDCHPGAGQHPATPCLGVLPFFAQIPSVKREGETIASGECDDDVEHRAHVLPCLCTQIQHLQTLLKTGERNHEMKGQVLSSFSSNSDFNFPHFYLFASFPDHCGQPMKSIPRKEATFF